MSDVRPIQHGRDHTWIGSDRIPGAAAPAVLNAIIDGMGAAIDTGIKGDVLLEQPYTITGWTLLADTDGDVVVDVWVDELGNYPPDSGDSITAAAPPTLIGQDSAHDTTLDGWSTELDAGDTLRFNVDSASAISRLTLALTLQPR